MAKAKRNSKTPRTKPKPFAKKIVTEEVYADRIRWTVQYGELRRGKGRPASTEHLFRIVGEKIPYAALSIVKEHLKSKKHTYQGVYIAHDSMGCPRYIGRGNIFARLESHKKRNQLELEYFSFYVVSEKKHEREVESLLIRAAGFLLEFNDRKKRVGIAPGNIKDYEVGTIFYERQHKKGAPKKRVAKKRVAKKRVAKKH